MHKLSNNSENIVQKMKKDGIIEVVSNKILKKQGDCEHCEKSGFILPSSSLR